MKELIILLVVLMLQGFIFLIIITLRKKRKNIREVIKFSIIFDVSKDEFFVYRDWMCIKRGLSTFDEAKKWLDENKYKYCIDLVVAYEEEIEKLSEEENNNSLIQSNHNHV